MTDYDSEDAAALLREHPHFGEPPRAVIGNAVSFRSAAVDDAEFILSLRLDPKLNAHLSPTPPSIEAQREYLSLPRDGFYFIIEAEGRPVGTVRLYDQRGASFSWGSWILRDHPRVAALESALMVYRIGLELGFTSAHFDVRHDNDKVRQFHERMGAEKTSQTDQDIFYRMDKSAMLAAFERYGDRSKAEIIW